LPRTQRESYFESDPLLLLNEELEDLRLPHEISEPALEGLLNMLEGSGTSGQPYYWLSMARIFELALFCAGHYADQNILGCTELAFDPNVWIDFVIFTVLGEYYPITGVNGKYPWGRRLD